MLQQYLPILVFMAVATAIGLVLLGLGFLLGRGNKDDEKLSPYECGFDPFDFPGQFPLMLLEDLG